MFRQQLSPFLNNGLTLATCNASGKIPVSEDWFIIIVNGLEISHFIDLSSLFDTSSLPDEFLLFKLLIMVNVRFFFSYFAETKTMLSGIVKIISES